MRRLRIFLDMVRFEHTIFALPFAYLGMLLAANWPPAPGGIRLPTVGQFIWISVAMAAARTLAFAINRYADRYYDARNPRTARRPIPTGRLSPALRSLGRSRMPQAKTSGRTSRTTS